MTEAAQRSIVQDFDGWQPLLYLSIQD